LTFFDFLATASGQEVLRILEGAVNIVAAILTGAALRNISQVKKMIGGIVKPGLVRRLFRRARHSTPAEPDAKPDAFQSLTLVQKVDMLKDNIETVSLRQGVDSKDVHERLDRVDPPTRRH
jgi:hypothetical protein